MYYVHTHVLADGPPSVYVNFGLFCLLQLRGAYVAACNFAEAEHFFSFKMPFDKEKGARRANCSYKGNEIFITLSVAQALPAVSSTLVHLTHTFFTNFSKKLYTKTSSQ